MEELKEFAKRLKEIRNEMKLSQKELAEKIGITAASLSAYELNLKNPSFTTVMKIAEIYGVSLDWLCGKAKKKVRNTINTDSDIFQMFIDISDCLLKQSEDIGNVSVQISKQKHCVVSNIKINNRNINFEITEKEDVLNG